MENKQSGIEYEPSANLTLMEIFDERLRTIQEVMPVLMNTYHNSNFEWLFTAHCVATACEQEVSHFIEEISGKSEKKILRSLEILLDVTRDYSDQMKSCLEEAEIFYENLDSSHYKGVPKEEATGVIRDAAKNLEELSLDIYRIIYLKTLSRLKMNTESSADECESRIIREVSEIFDEWRRANLETEWQLYEMSNAIDLDYISESFRIMSSIGNKIGNFIELMRGAEEEKISEYLKSLTRIVERSSRLIESCNKNAKNFFEELDDCEFEGVPTGHICGKMRRATQALGDLGLKLSNIN